MKYKVEIAEFAGQTHYILIGPARWSSLFAIDVPDELINEYKILQRKLRDELDQHARLGSK